MTLMLKVVGWDDIGEKQWDILKDQKLSVGVKDYMFVCALKGGGDIAYMKGHSTP